MTTILRTFLTHRAWAAALLVLAAVMFSFAAAHAQEVIHSFDSDVQVAKNGTLTVTETIRVRAEGRAIRRGIYRDFPTTFLDGGGRVRNVPFKLLSVTRDGRPEPHFTEGQGNGIRIYAGDKDVLLRRGDYTYVFTYETGRQIRWLDGTPELNWNVTGNFWTFPIDAATYRLRLPDGVRPARWTAFTGNRGDRGTDWRGNIEANGTLVVSTTRPLRPREGLTVVAEIPQGAVEPPSESTELWWAFLDYRRWIFGAIGVILVLIYYGYAWNAVGRDPKRGTIIPLFHPPKGISPALANYVHHWGFSRDKWRAFTAAALSLGVKGLLKFDDKDDTLTLKTTGKEPKGGNGGLPPGERAIFKWVKGQGGSATIDSANGSAVASIGSTFTTSIEGENKNKFFRRNIGYTIAGLVLTLAVVIGVLIFGNLSEGDIGILILMFFVGVFLGVFMVPILAALFGAARRRSLIRVAMSLVVLGIIGSGLANVIEATSANGFRDILPMLGWLISDNPFPFALVGSLAALNGLFLYLMRAPTGLGRPIMDQLDGFKLYLETAESDRLNLQAPEITTERFESLLPYAVALNVEKPWSEAFSAALARAHPGEAEPMSHYHPGWHSGSNWSSSNFSSAVASTVSSASSAFASAVPVSSGSSGFSSGGGGSGGGGGGGGGGGW